MKIFKWWKRVELDGLGGITMMVIPEQSIEEDQAFFSKTVETVKKATDCNYVLIERTERILDSR